MPKIGCHGYVHLTDPETNTRLNIYTNMCTIHENLEKVGLVVSQNSLLQAIAKKEQRKSRKESNSGIK